MGSKQKYHKWKKEVKVQKTLWVALVLHLLSGYKEFLSHNLFPTQLST